MLNHTRIAAIGTTVVMACFLAFIGFRGFVRPVIMGWPVSADSAADFVIGHLSEEQRTQLASAKESDLIGYHFGLGMYIRNQFGLWQGNAALLWSACGECQPQDTGTVSFQRTHRASSFCARTLNFNVRHCG